MARKELPSIWEPYEVTLEFVRPLMGSTPRNPEMIKSWLEMRMPPENLEEQVEEVIATVETVEERMWVGFRVDENGLFVEDYHVRAHLKDCARVLRNLKGVAGYRAKFIDRCYVSPRRIYLIKSDGTIINKPDGFWERPIHVVTPRGERSALKRTDYVEGAFIRFTLLLLKDRVIKEDDLVTLLDYGAVHGFLGERSMGYGRYTYHIEGNGWSHDGGYTE